jgi:hypothetical protein
MSMGRRDSINETSSIALTKTSLTVLKSGDVAWLSLCNVTLYSYTVLDVFKHSFTRKAGDIQLV